MRQHCMAHFSIEDECTKKIKRSKSVFPIHLQLLNDSKISIKVNTFYRRRATREEEYKIVMDELRIHTNTLKRVPSQTKGEEKEERNFSSHKLNSGGSIFMNAYILPRKIEPTTLPKKVSFCHSSSLFCRQSLFGGKFYLVLFISERK